MIKKKFKTAIGAVLVSAMMFSTNVFAAETINSMSEEIVETQTYTGNYSTNFSLSYIDDYNVSHRLAGTATCRATISWDEGIAGWINSAQFDIPTVTSDGVAVSVRPSGSVIGTDSSCAYQIFTINNSHQYVTVRLNCDAYGNASLSATVS